MRDIPTASQIIAALVKRIERAEGEGPVVLTYADLMQFGTRLPAALEWNDDDTEVTLSIQIDNAANNPKWKAE